MDNIKSSLANLGIDPNRVDALTLTDVVRVFFTFAISLTIFLNTFETIRSRIYVYGKAEHTTTTAKTTTDKEGEQQPSKYSSNPLLWPFDLIANTRVPHFYFYHFYALGLYVHIFWLIQVLRHGRGVQYLLRIFSHPTPPSILTTPPPQQNICSIIMAMFLMVIQCFRRLYESTMIQRPGNSSMSIMIYGSGLLFYFFIGFACFCEGTLTLLQRPDVVTIPVSPLDFLAGAGLSGYLGIMLFTFASGMQFDAHNVLANLPKYSLPPPNHLLFKWILCPHYTAECLIYLSIGLVAAPEGQIIGKTWWIIIAFVVMNLGCSSMGTKKWYEEKFGKEAIKGRWRMWPGIF